MLDPVVWVAHSLDQRDQDRHVFRPTASHHAVDRNGPSGCGTAVRKQHSKYLVRITVREFEKRFDPFRRRRDDWQAVAPFVLNEQAIDLVHRAGEDDISRRRVLHGFDVAGRFRQVLHDVVEGDAVNVFGELRIALRADMARYQSNRQVGEAEPDAGCARLTDEPFTNERRRGNAGFLSGRTRPQHGGRAAASTAHARDDGVDAQGLHLPRQVREDLPLVGAVG